MTVQRTARQALTPDADPAWSLEQPGFDAPLDCSRESRFAVSNGFLGVRGGRTINRLPVAAVVPRAYVAGFFNRVGPDQPTSALVPAPDWLRINLSLSPEGETPDVADVSFHHRTLDFRRGALMTDSRIADTAGLAVRPRVLRLVSLHRRAIGLQLVHLDVDAGAVLAPRQPGAGVDDHPPRLPAAVIEQKIAERADPAVIRLDGRVFERRCRSVAWTKLIHSLIEASMAKPRKLLAV